MNFSQAASNISFQKVISSKLTWIFSFSILTAIAAQVAIPVKPVPFTLQTLIVLVSGAFLGARNGAYSQLIYLGLGAIGLPVFAQVPDGAIGLARLFGPTGGYLLAFPLAAFIVGHIVKQDKSYVIVVTSMFLGQIVIILFGVLHLSFFYINDFIDSLQAGAAIFSLWTVILVFSAASIYSGLRNKIQKK